MKYSALIIGCGNIGALYDLKDPSRVWTHARAFYNAKNIHFDITDSDKKIAKQVAKAYNVEFVDVDESSDFGRYDIVSITTPTVTHYAYLKSLLQQNIPLVICEKPVAAGIPELNKLETLYRKSDSKVLVNYIRRFQPAYARLRDVIRKRTAKAACTAINIKYQRGILNNGGHAFDLLEYLFDKPFDFEKFVSQKISFDAFEFDPTVSGSCIYQNCPVMLLGVEKASYAVFEIELFFPTGKIVVCHSGNEIRYYEQDKSGKSLVENNDLREKNILARYMMPVVDKATKLLEKAGEEDNFQQALDLNKRIVKLINVLRKKAG